MGRTYRPWCGSECWKRQQAARKTDRKSPRLQHSSSNVLAGPMGCPQAKVTNQRQGRACMSPALCPVIGQEKPVGREAPVGNGGGSRRTASGAISQLRSCSWRAENAFQGHPHSPCAARGGFLYAGLAAAPYPFWLVSY